MLKKLRDRKFCQKIRKLNENKEFLEYNFPKLTQKEIEFLVLCLVKKKKIKSVIFKPFLKYILKLRLLDQ